jgi:hypothetical protein
MAGLVPATHVFAWSGTASRRWPWRNVHDAMLMTQFP